MTVATREPPSSAAERRRRTLELPLSLLRGLFCGPASPPAVEVPAAGGTLELDPWVAAQLRAAFAADGAVPEIAGLVTHGVALLVKIRGDRHRLDHAGPDDERGTLAAELMLDLGIGTALTRDLQRAIDAAVQAGGAPQAKELSRFRHELRRAVAEVKQRISEAERDRAEGLSDALTDEPAAKASPADDPRLRLLVLEAARGHDRERLAAARRRLRRLALVLPSRTEILVALLLIGALAWVGLASLRGMRAERFVELTLGHAPPGDPLVAVEARAPSLFAAVDPQAWAALDEPGRRAVVERLSGLLLAHDYRGALVTLPDGRPVARWLRSRGVELIATDEASATPASWGITRVRGREAPTGEPGNDPFVEIDADRGMALAPEP